MFGVWSFLRSTDRRWKMWAGFWSFTANTTFDWSHRDEIDRHWYQPIPLVLFDSSHKKNTFLAVANISFSLIFSLWQELCFLAAVRNDQGKRTLMKPQNKFQRKHVAIYFKLRAFFFPLIIFACWGLRCADPLLLCEVVTYLGQECNIETACQAESGIR